MDTLSLFADCILHLGLCPSAQAVTKYSEYDVLGLNQGGKQLLVAMPQFSGIADSRL